MTTPSSSSPLRGLDAKDVAGSLGVLRFYLVSFVVLLPLSEWSIVLNP